MTPVRILICKIWMIINWSDNYKVSVLCSKPDKYCCIHNFTRLILSGKVSQNILGGCNLRAGSWTNANRGNPLRNWNISQEIKETINNFRNILFYSWQTRNERRRTSPKVKAMFIHCGQGVFFANLGVDHNGTCVCIFVCVWCQGQHVQYITEPSKKNRFLYFSHISRPPGPRVNVHYDA